MFHILKGNVSLHHHYYTYFTSISSQSFLIILPEDIFQELSAQSKTLEDLVDGEVGEVVGGEVREFVCGEFRDFVGGTVGEDISITCFWT